MNREKPRRQMIDVDALQASLSVADVARHYGFSLPEGFGANGEQRMRCPCTDCKGNQDNRAVSINTSDPAKRWKCHHNGYGCSAGNLVSLAYAMKHGGLPEDGRPKGAEFYAIAQDLQAIAGGDLPTPQEKHRSSDTAESSAKRRVAAEQSQTKADAQAAIENRPNVPLVESDNENSRKLDRLDERFTVALSELPPAASVYARKRRFLLDEALAKECRYGYLSNKEKSMVRGKWVYGVMDEEGRPLAWIGRNVGYEQEAKPSPADDSKYRFPRQEYFRRGLELYGQEFLTDERFADSLAQHGLLLVEGFNDRIRLHQLGVMAVAMMSNTLTDEQTTKLVRFAGEHAGNRVGVMHDNDKPGVEGAKDSLWRLQEAGVEAYLVWSPKTHSARYDGWQPEQLTPTDLQQLWGTSER